MQPILWAMGMSAILFCGMQLQKKGRLLFAVEDEDMKIAPSCPTSIQEETDSTDRSVLDFVRQKNNGNVTRAKMLGAQLAGVVLDMGKQLLGGPRRNQQLMLVSYGLNRMVETLSPNSTVAHTVLNTFYDQVQEKDEQIYQAINDSAAYTLYMLEARQEDNMGKVYAKLCGNPALEEEGNLIYQVYYSKFRAMQEQAHFVA